MTTERIEALWREAQRRRLLPADAVLPATPAARPWPVVLLTALGAWLAAVPVLLAVGLLIGKSWTDGAAYPVGAALMVVVVAKLFFVDLANVSAIGKIASFLTVGALLVITGYLAPLPPRRMHEQVTE